MPSYNNENTVLETVAEKAYALIASLYPVCSSSDEFYFFPQVILEARDWSIWDDFSANTVADIAGSLQAFESELAGCMANNRNLEEQVDIEVLQQVLKTLREQIVDVAPHQSQPTFHLTVLATGLAEALATEGEEAWRARVSGAAAFIQRANECLCEVPALFKALGLEMLVDLKQWLESLQKSGIYIGDLLQKLNWFQEVLQETDTVEEYRISEVKFDTLLQEHIGCGMTVDELNVLLQSELEEMEAVLANEVVLLAPGKNWREVKHEIPFVPVGEDGEVELYQHQLEKMETHCRQHGLVPTAGVEGILKVETVPAYLAAVRASDAYSAAPGYPPRGGTFYVMKKERSHSGQPGRTLEYRMTAAHEAWPGHHLLDSCRWSLTRPVRRPLESPLFYEGWACLAEELMARTGYFAEPWDHFLLARRRAERAVRGLIDVGLQSGRMTIENAVSCLVAVGYTSEAAASVVPKYLLRPGYQVCYTLGLKQAMQLLERFGGENLGRFVGALLSQGEIGFGRLEKVLSEKEARSQR